MTDGLRGLMALAAALGIVAALAGRMGAAHPALDSLGAFRVHLGVVFAGLGLLSVAFAARTARALSLAGLALTGLLLAPAWLGGPRAPVAGARALILYSHNLRYDNPTPGAVIDAVRAADADIVALQEVSAANRPIVSALAPDYRAVVDCPFRRVGDLVILARGRLAGAPGCIEVDGLAWAPLQTRAGPLTVATVHLTWPWPHTQAQQVDRLRPHFAALDGPLVIAGDFNAAPWSHAVAQIAALTGTRATPGLRLTFRRPQLWPGLALDHVLAGGGVAARTRMAARAGSDHAALVTRLLPPGD